MSFAARHAVATRRAAHRLKGQSKGHGTDWGAFLLGGLPYHFTLIQGLRGNSIPFRQAISPSSLCPTCSPRAIRSMICPRCPPNCPCNQWRQVARHRRLALEATARSRSCLPQGNVSFGRAAAGSPPQPQSYLGSRHLSTPPTSMLLALKQATIAQLHSPPKTCSAPFRSGQAVRSGNPYSPSRAGSLLRGDALQST